MADSQNRWIGQWNQSKWRERERERKKEREKERERTTTTIKGLKDIVTRNICLATNKLRGLETLERLFAISAIFGDFLFTFLFASLHSKSLLKKGVL